MLQEIFDIPYDAEYFNVILYNANEETFLQGFTLVDGKITNDYWTVHPEEAYVFNFLECADMIAEFSAADDTIEWIEFNEKEVS